MSYKKHGGGTSVVEVTHVSRHGVWVMVYEKEMFLPFDRFPWFQDAPIGKVLNVELPSEQHLYWPELDVDLEVDSIINPERYPLVSTVGESGEGYSAVDEWDWEKVDETVLALLQLTLHDERRAWKGFDFDVMDRLFEKGLIFDPKGKAKSVALTDEGLARSKELFGRLFKKGC
jgi:hypothetical protein